MATPDQTIKAIDALVKPALEAAARQAMTESNKWIPIATGDLRRSGDVGQFSRQGNKASITLSWDTRYARKHYFRSLRHYMPGGKPARVTSYARPPGKAGRANLYGRAYRQALKDGVMRRVANGLIWLDRAIADGRSRRKINKVFVNFYR